MTGKESLPDSNIRSQSYFVACTVVICWKCGHTTPVWALAVPENHETRDLEAEDDADDDRTSSSAWRRPGVNAFLFFVEHLSNSVRQRLTQMSRSFCQVDEPTPHWANHCEFCKAPLGDHELHCEPDIAFMPSSERTARKIELLQILEPLEAEVGGYACDPEFFPCMRKS